MNLDYAAGYQRHLCVCMRCNPEGISCQSHSYYRGERLIKPATQSVLVPYQNSVPVYDLDAAAGIFSDLQDVKDFEWIEIPARYKATDDLFASRVVGESMNKVIPNGSVCLFRKY